MAFVLTFSVRTGTTGAGGWALVGKFGMAPLPRWLSLTVIFLLTVATLGTLAQEVARTFSLFEPLDAYRLDIGGSLLGIVTFAGLSFLRMPPLAWAATSAVGVRRARSGRGCGRGAGCPRPASRRSW